MATVLGSNASSTIPLYAPAGRGAVAFAHSTYEIASALSKDDIIDLFHLPPCRVIDGFLQADDIDTGTEALEIDVGYAGATTALLASGVLAGDAVAGHAPAAQVYCHFTGCVGGPVAITAKTKIIASITAAANAGGTGTVYVGAYYIEPA